MPNSEWWDPENGSSDVVRHAPDDENYHYPDSEQLGKMRSGLTTVLVPRARDDGRSLAFDGTKAGVVHVDPDAPDGGAIVDVSQIRKSDMNQALGGSRFPHQAYYKLGVPPAARPTGRKAPPPRRENPVIGNGYVVPASDRHGRQVEEAEEGAYGDFAPIYPKEQEVLTPAPLLPPVPGVPQQPQQFVPAMPQQPQQPAQGGYQPPPQPQPLPQGYAPPMYYPPPPPPQPDPAMQAMLGQILGGLQNLSHRVKAAEERADDRHEAPARRERPVDAVATAPVGQPPRRGGSRFPRPTPIGQAPRRDADGNDPYDDPDESGVFADDAQEIGRSKASPRRREKRAQHIDDVAEEMEPRRDGIIAGFETLKLKYVNGPLPLKAKCKVFFEFGETGRQSAYYHDVVVAKNCIALVYDTRYEDGTQFDPPDLDEKVFTLGVPHMGKKEYRVSSMGFSFSMGVFDIIVLVNHGDDAEEYDDEG